MPDDCLKPGEYVGGGGVRWSFAVTGSTVALSGDYALAPRHHVCLIEDLRAAAEALTALADERETRVVALGDYYRIIVTPSERRVESRTNERSPWMPDLDEAIDAILAAYDAGMKERDD